MFCRSGSPLPDACCVDIGKETLFQYQVLVTLGIKVRYLHIRTGYSRPYVGLGCVLG